MLRYAHSGTPSLGLCGSRGRLTYLPCSQMEPYAQDRQVGAYLTLHPGALPVDRVRGGLCGCRQDPFSHRRMMPLA